MKIALDVSISFFQTEKEEFELSGWYSAYTEDNGRSKAIGYVSEKKLKDWGYDIKDGSDILICQSNDMDWKDTEEKLYEDVPMKDNSQQIIATDTAKNRAVKEMTGSYGMAAVEAVVIICGMFLTCLQCDADLHVGRYPADGTASYNRYNEKTDP